MQLIFRIRFRQAENTISRQLGAPKSTVLGVCGASYHTARQHSRQHSCSPPSRVRQLRELANQSIESKPTLAALLKTPCGLPFLICPSSQVPFLALRASVVPCTLASECKRPWFHQALWLGDESETHNSLLSREKRTLLLATFINNRVFPGL